MTVYCQYYYCFMYTYAVQMIKSGYFLTVYIIVHVYRFTYHAVGDIDWCNSFEMNLR